MGLATLQASRIQRRCFSYSLNFGEEKGQHCNAWLLNLNQWLFIVSCIELLLCRGKKTGQYMDTIVYLRSPPSPIFQSQNCMLSLQFNLSIDGLCIGERPALSRLVAAGAFWRISLRRLHLSWRLFLPLQYHRCIMKWNSTNDLHRSMHVNETSVLYVLFTAPRVWYSPSLHQWVEAELHPPNQLLI